jgi:MFS family permease
MHPADIPPATPPMGGDRPWWRELNRYHWFVLTVAALGWLFDCLDQQLFILARNPAMRELLTAVAGETPEEFRKRADVLGTWATSIFLIGWGTGGIIFGILGDRIGRARTMVLTILVYSLFTGLSALSVGFWDFALYRFLTGLGVGGEFAVGVALVAEVMPDRARPFALGLLQALSAVGNVTAALINMVFGHLESQGVFQNFFILGYGPVSAWRMMFVIGALPALLALVIRRRLREPERWVTAATTGQARQLGSVGELLGDARWRRNVLVGLCMAISGQIGLWGIGFYFPELTRTVFRSTFEAQGLTASEVEGELKVWAGITSLLLNAGAFFGIAAFSRVTHHLGRKPTFAIAFVLALASTALVFGGLDQFHEVYWMIPLMGFCQLSLFGGYAIYFPELFPTRLRSTGTSFCYNVGRYAAAAGPPIFGLLLSRFDDPPPLPHRYAGLLMCSVFLVGLFALFFAPETKGKPLPE